jgi:hypothetical protein
MLKGLQKLFGFHSTVTQTSSPIEVPLATPETPYTAYRSRTIAEAVCGVDNRAQELSHSTARFARTSRLSAAQLRGRITAILDDEPRMTLDGKTSSERSINADLRLHASGRMSFPRLRAFNNLLFGESPRHEVTVVENGPGSLIHLSLEICMMGCQMFVKDLDWNKPVFSENLANAFGYVPANFHYMEYKEIDQPTPAEAAFWIHPNQPQILGEARYVYRRGKGQINYMGRDVRPGGFLIIQSESEIFTPWSKFDTDLWEEIWIGCHNAELFASPLANDPADSSWGENHYTILRRK